MWILAVPSSFRHCSRGYPGEFDPKELIVTAGEYLELAEFCRQYGIEVTTNPAWYLSSYWDKV